MTPAVIGAAVSVVLKALAPVMDPVLAPLLEAWAASKGLGMNVKDLKAELLCVQAVLERVLYCCCYRVQEEGMRYQLFGTTDLADREVSGCMPKLTSRACTTIQAAGKRLPCSSLPSVRRVDDDDDSVHISPKRCETPKLRFNRVDGSNRMKDIVEQLKRVRQQVSSIVGPLDSNSAFVQDNSQSRPVTTSYIIEPKLYGRDLLMNSVTSDITEDKYFANKLTVLPIVGPGGIGKTTSHNTYIDKWGITLMSKFGFVYLSVSMQIGWQKKL